MKVLGICGYARSGKDTLYETIEKYYKGNVYRVAFADPIKHDLAEFILTNFNISVWTDIDEEKDIIRPILVAYGESQRKIDPLYWVKRGMYQLDFNSDDLYVFTDVRNKTELEAIKEYGDSIFIKRAGREPANNTEEEFTKPLESLTDYIVSFIDFSGCGLYLDEQAGVEMRRKFDNWFLSSDLYLSNPHFVETNISDKS